MTRASAPLLMRSKLFVPGSRPELFAKAATSAADALSFDLEDAVAPDRKADARAALAAHLATAGAGGGKTVVVRVNPVGTALFADDLSAVAGPAVHAINLPMVEEPEAVVAAAEALEVLDGAADVRLLVNIETPKGLRRAAALAAAHPRVCGLQIGYADLLEPTGIDRRDEAALAYIRLAVRLAAAEAGVPAFDAAFAAVKDPDGYRAECEAARRHGFSGKTCIHPSQIATANEVFRPSAVAIEKARRIVEAAERAEASGVGAYMVDGQMVDAPFVASARALLATAARFSAPTGVSA